MKRSEEELAVHVVTWLKEKRFKVYQEVCAGSGVADIVAVLGDLHWIIECKTSLSLSVMAQARHWRGWAHLRSICVPATSRASIARDYAMECLENEHVGVITVKVDGRLDEKSAPGLCRKPWALKRLKEGLCDEQLDTCAAGSSRGGYWTTFKSTRRRVLAFVKENPGCLMNQIVSDVDHHYGSRSSARACLRRYIEQGVIDDIEARIEEGKTRYYEVVG